MFGNPCFRFHVKFWGCDSHGSHHHLRCPDQHLRFLTGIFHINQDLETKAKRTGKNMKNVGKIKQQTQTKCLSDKKQVHNHHSQQIHEKDETRQKFCCSLRFPGCSFYTVVERFSVFCLEFLQIQVPAIAEEMETPDQRMGPLWAAYQTRKRLTRATGPQILVVNKFLNHSIAGYLKIKIKSTWMGLGQKEKGEPQMSAPKRGGICEERMNHGCRCSFYQFQHHQHHPNNSVVLKMQCLIQNRACLIGTNGIRKPIVLKISKF